MIVLVHHALKSHGFVLLIDWMLIDLMGYDFGGSILLRLRVASSVVLDFLELAVQVEVLSVFPGVQEVVVSFLRAGRKFGIVRYDMLDGITGPNEPAGKSAPIHLIDVPVAVVLEEGLGLY